MRHECMIVYTITRDKESGKILGFSFINSFETEEQARASLQYEVDLSRIENGEEAKWIDDYTILLPPGWCSDEETIMTYDCIDYYDEKHPLMQYPKGEEKCNTIAKTAVKKQQK